MKIKSKVGLSGVFKSIRVLKNGRVVREVGEFPNLILDTGLARMAVAGNSVPALYTYVRVGTGNAEPLETDQNLQSQIASASVPNSYAGGSGVDLEEGYAWREVTWTFAAGEVVGNVSEIGTGWAASSSGSLFSRALVVDGEGIPTSITVLADEQLQITWQHRWYWPTEDVTGVLVNEGSRGGSYNYIVRAADVANWVAGRPGAGGINLASNVGANTSANHALYEYPSEIGSITTYPSGGASNLGGTTGTATAGGKSVSRDLLFALDQGNSQDGISCIFFRSYDSSSGAAQTKSSVMFQVEFDPPIKKTAEDIMEIGIEISWDRYDPEDDS